MMIMLLSNDIQKKLKTEGNAGQFLHLANQKRKDT